MTIFQQFQLKAIEPAESQPEVIVAGDNYFNSSLTQFDMIDQLIGQFRQREQAINATKTFFENAVKMGVMSYFIDGARLSYGSDLRPFIPTDESSALASLRVEFWNRLLNETQIFEVMPAAKREKARAQFAGLECPPFDENTVRPTMQDLLQQRVTFFSERVDGIFRGLSGVSCD